MRRLLRPAAVALGLLAALPAAAAPQRIVSLNLCADQLVLALADRADISSLSWLVADCELSARCEEVGDLPLNHASAEELFAAQPTLVIAGRYTTRPAVAVARRRGLPVIEIDVPRDFAAVRSQIATVAEAVGQPARGAAMLAELDRRLAAVPPPAEKKPVAAIYQANGFTVGTGSLIDKLLERAGLENLARRLDIDNYPFLPLEGLIAGAPDLLVLDEPRAVRPALALAILKHPALAQAFAPERRATIPSRLWICGGPTIVDALERLIAARQRVAALPR